MVRASFPQPPGSTVEVYLVRHGQTSWNKLRKCQGVSDIELNEHGRAQAQAVADALADEALQAVYASTLQRSWQTAEFIAAPHGLEVVQREGLKELNHGVLEGLHSDEIRAQHGSFIEKWLRDPTGMIIPGGESLEAVQERSWEALQTIVRQHPEGKIVVVGHQMTNLTLLCKALDMPISNYRRLAQEPSAINVLRFQERFVSLLRLNDTCHLRNRQAPLIDAS